MYTASFYDNSLHANVFCVVNVFQKMLTGRRYNESNYPICRNFGGKEGDFRRGRISGTLWYINLTTTSLDFGSTVLCHLSLTVS